MLEIKIIIPEEEKNKLQLLATEVESRQSLIAFMINNDMINSMNFQLYQNEYKQFYFQYAQAKTIFQKKYVDPILIEKNIILEKASWNLDFNTCECIISIME